MITEWRFCKLESIPNRLICDDGSLYNLKTGKRMKLKNSRNGYLRIRLYNKGKEFYKWVHRVVYEAFIGNCEELHVHHKDKIRINNYYLNLEGLPPEKHRYYHRNETKMYTKEELVGVPF